jgi:hypothetical protein
LKEEERERPQEVISRQNRLASTGDGGVELPSPRPLSAELKEYQPKAPLFGSGAFTSHCNMRNWVVCGDSQKNKSGQNALQTIFSNRLDIFDPQFWSVFLKMQLFHQPRLIAPAILQPNDGLRFRF